MTYFYIWIIGFVFLAAMEIIDSFFDKYTKDNLLLHLLFCLTWPISIPAATMAFLYRKIKASKRNRRLFFYILFIVFIISLGITWSFLSGNKYIYRR